MDRGLTMSKFLAMLLAIAGGLLGSQAPSFTLQYMQNLNGRVDELKPLVEKFDTDVAAYGYSREQALKECATASGLLDALCGSYAETIERYEILSQHLTALQQAPELKRPIILAQSYQRDIVDSVVEEFKPAIPTTVDGAAYGGGGFLGTWIIGSIFFGILGAPFSRRTDPDGRWA